MSEAHRLLSTHLERLGNGTPGDSRPLARVIAEIETAITELGGGVGAQALPRDTPRRGGGRLVEAIAAVRVPMLLDTLAAKLIDPAMARAGEGGQPSPSAPDSGFFDQIPEVGGPDAGGIEAISVARLRDTLHALEAEVDFLSGLTRNDDVLADAPEAAAEADRADDAPAPPARPIALT